MQHCMSRTLADRGLIQQHWRNPYSPVVRRDDYRIIPANMGPDDKIYITANFFINDLNPRCVPSRIRADQINSARRKRSHLCASCCQTDQKQTNRLHFALISIHLPKSFEKYKREHFSNDLSKRTCYLNKIMFTHSYKALMAERLRRYVQVVV